MWLGEGDYSIPPHIITGGRGRESLPRRSGGVNMVLVLSQREQSGWHGCSRIVDSTESIFVWESLSLLYTFIINVVALTVCFLSPLLFLVNFSYFNL